MTEAQHTPGSWHRDGHNLSAIIRLKYPVGHPDCKHITGTYETLARCEGENWDANSRLIAAAPELLALAGAMLGFDIATPKDYATKGADAFSPMARHIIELQNKARTVIAKATWQQ